MPRMALEPVFRAGIPWLLGLLLLAITAQIYLATAGLLNDPGLLGPHRALAPWLVGLAAVAFAVALLARDLPVAIGCGGMLVLFLSAGPLIRSLGTLRSLHAVAALLAFAICLLLLRGRLPSRKQAGR